MKISCLQIARVFREKDLKDYWINKYVGCKFCHSLYKKGILINEWNKCPFNSNYTQEDYNMNKEKYRKEGCEETKADIKDILKEIPKEDHNAFIFGFLKLERK